MSDLAYAEQGDGTPLLLLHAFPFSKAMWRFQESGLTSGTRLVTPDLPGFGDTPVPAEPPDLAVMARGVLALLDRLGLEQVVLGGLSMGGYVAMEILRQRPEAVAALVLADTKAAPDPEAAAENRRRTAAALDELDERARPDALADDLLPTLLGETTLQERPETLAWLREVVESTSPRGAAWALRAMADRPDSFDTLRGVRVPALVVVGSQDRLSPPSDAEAMAEAIPGARLAVLEAAGHLSAAETPDEFNRVIEDFVGGLG